MATQVNPERQLAAINFEDDAAPEFMIVGLSGGGAINQVNSIGGTPPRMELAIVPEPGTATIELIADIDNIIDAGTTPEEYAETGVDISTRVRTYSREWRVTGATKITLNLSCPSDPPNSIGFSGTAGVDGITATAGSGTAPDFEKGAGSIYAPPAPPLHQTGVTFSVSGGSALLVWVAGFEPVLL